MSKYNFPLFFQVDSFFEAGYSNNNVASEPKNIIAYQSLNDIAIHYTKPQDIIHASNSSSSTSLSFNDPGGCFKNELIGATPN